MQIKKHVIVKNVVEQMTLVMQQYMMIEGWGISITHLNDDDEDLYMPEIMAFISPNETDMIPIMFPVEMVYDSPEEAINDTYFNGINILGERIMPIVAMFDTKQNLICQFSIPDIIEDVIDGYDVDIDVAMEEKKTVTLH